MGNMNKQPNILLILIDDLGWKDLSCQGSSFYETPNINRLASQGMTFSDAYAACPVCSPTRASFMTGKYPATVGITNWIDFRGNDHPARGKLIDVPYLKELPTSEYSIAKALGAAGYATWHIGKWHLGGEGYLPEDHGFDVNIGGCHWGCPSDGGYFSPWTIEALKDVDVPDGTYLTDYLTDQAIDLIEQHDDAPFFLNMWYYSVHTPIQAKEDKIRKYELKAKKMGLDQLKTFEEGEPFPILSKKNERIKRRLIQSDPVYAAMIESLDENIGRLMSALEASGQSDNTLVVFSSDNGGLSTAGGSPTSNAPLAEGKGWMYEGGTREPLFVRWPGMVEPNSSCSEAVTSPDFYPTFLDAAGLAPIPNQHSDGVSLLPLLNGEARLEREAIFWHYPHYGGLGGTPGSSVRSGDYKLMEFFEDGHFELYNLREDIGEKHDLSEQNPEKLEQLKRLLHAWQKEVEALRPEINPDWPEN